jgi:peptide/nickel transport system substrate-binding protein
MVIAFSMVASCAAPAPEVIEKEVVVEKPVVETVVVEKEKVVEKPVVETVIVEKEKVVEKEVVVTPTPKPIPTEPQRGGTLYMSFGPDFVTFDPYYDVTNVEFKPMMYDPVVRLSDEGEIEPWLAESFEVSEDGLSITLHLRKGVKFHNGREMTADDVVWSIERARDQDIGHHLGDYFTTCTGATKIDEDTVEVTYSRVTHSALDGMARCYIFPKEALDDIETTPVGTGPFKLEEWVPGDHLTLVGFEDYWREGLPYLDKVVVKPIPDEQARMLNLLAGGIDFLMEVPWADIELLDRQPDINLIRQPHGFRFDAFIFNVTRPPFDDTLVRQAMNYAVDREKMRQLVYHGQAIMTQLPWSDVSWAYPEDLSDYYTFDLDKAKELLAEAGYPDGFKTQMVIRGTSGVRLDLAQVYQEDLAKIGVEMEILPTELPQYWPILFDSDFAIVSHDSGQAGVDPAGFFEGAAPYRPFRNFFKITENETWFPKYEALLEQASLDMDQEKRKEMYHDALEIALEQGWCITLGWRQITFAMRDFVKGFRTDMDGYVWLTEVWLVK